MGTSTTPKYRVEYIDQNGKQRATWKGHATNKRLEHWRQHMNESFKLGNVNDHVSKSLGFMPHISRAVIINQKTQSIVVKVIAPMFEVI